ncbi:MAG: ribosome maturation factor RimP [Alphaproteobacteria bacterium]|nr:MAG: ribosome maturation factor RimP [Alphaproteobacteria bacterium]
MARDDTAQRLEKMAIQTAGPMGLAVVRVRLLGGTRPVLEVMAERSDGTPISIGECARLSRGLSAALDVDDPVPGRYVLEVGSPGLERPLTKPQDYDRFAGQLVAISLYPHPQWPRRLKGILRGREGQDVLVDAGPQGLLRIGLEAIEKAHLDPDLGPKPKPGKGPSKKPAIQAEVKEPAPKKSAPGKSGPKKSGPQKSGQGEH